MIQEKNNYDQIIDHFIIEIQVRFKKSNLEPVLDLFTLIMIDGEIFEVNYDKLVIYSNLNELKYEFKVFFFYCTAAIDANLIYFKKKILLILKKNEK
jgi:hypothetical protein